MLLFPPPIEIDENEGFTPENDLFKRRGFGESLARLVEKADDALVLGLDDAWGEGKTTFIKQWRGLLTSEEFKVDSIYYDAFANDYQDEPFETIADELYSFIDQKAANDDPDNAWREHKEGFLQGAQKWFAGKVASLGKVIGAGAGAAAASASGGGGAEVEGISAGIAAAGEAVGETMDEFFEARLKRKVGREGFHEALKTIGKVLRDRENKSLVFIIDELDRCRPDFALDLLESVKHVFSVPGIVFVLAYNGAQMKEHIRCRYGQKVKSDIYLNKFINITTRMPKSVNVRQPHNDDNCKFIKMLADRMKLNFNSEKILSVYATRKSLSLRELERIMTMVAISKASLPRAYVDWDEVILGTCLVRLLDDGLFAMLHSRLDCWNELSAFFEFGTLTKDELTHADLDFFQNTWTDLTNPDVPEERKNRFGRYNSEGPIPFFCRALTNFTTTNGDTLLFKMEGAT